MATLADARERVYLAHWAAINGIIRQRCWTDESRANAYAWSWHYFCRWYKPNGDNKRAALASAMYACRLGRRTYGKPPHSGYVDAMDRAEAAPWLDPPFSSEEADELNWCLDELPSRLQDVAQALADGCNRTETARRVGVTTETIRRRCYEIEAWLLARCRKAAA